MNYGGGGQDQRYNGGGGQQLTDYEYEGDKYYGQPPQLPSFPFPIRGSAQPGPTHAYHGGLHQPGPGLLSLPPMSSVTRGPTADVGVGTLSAAAAAHQMSRLGEAFKDSLAHHVGHMGSSKPGMNSSAINPYGVSVPAPYMPQQSASASGSGHSDRLYGGSAFSHASSGGGVGGLNEKSSPSPRSSGGSDGGYVLPSASSARGSSGSIQLPAPSQSHLSQLAGGAAHQAAVSLSHIAGGGTHLQSTTSSQQQSPAPVKTAASMNPKDLLELYSKWDQIDTNKAKRNKAEDTQAEEVRKERHNMAEKRRRSDMNGAIERLKSLLPQQVTNDRRLTKVEVLTETADHLTQVQNLCAKLITENKRLRAMLPGVKLEDEIDLMGDDAPDAAAEDGFVDNRERPRQEQRSGSADDGRERRSFDEDGELEDDDEDDDEEEAPKRQRRSESPGENSDSNGSGREGENGGSNSGGSEQTNGSGSGGSGGGGENERDEIAIDGRGDYEGRDSDNSNDGLTSQQRMPNEMGPRSGEPASLGAGDVGRREPSASFSGLAFSQGPPDGHQHQMAHMLRHQEHHNPGQPHHYHH